MLKIFEKLINEHGSSVILRERLELFSDKYIILEEKNKHLAERTKELESKLNQAKKEINKLNKVIETSAKPQRVPELNEIEVKILKFLFDRNEEYSAYGIALQFDLEVGIAEYHLNHLLEFDLVSDIFIIEEEISYSITPKGRTFIVEHT